jgi:splicing factor 1
MFGPFPLFWQELEGWEHHKQVRKLYLVATEKQESGKTVDMEELLRNALRNTHEQNSYAETDTQQMDTDDDPHNSISLAEQKSAEGIEADSAAGTEGDAEKKESNKRKRRSRWGDVPPAADNGTGTGETAIAAVSGDSAESKVDGTEDGGEDKPRRKSRWSTTMATTSAPNPLLNACAINTQGVLSQEAVQQTLVLQMKLKTVNERLMNLPTEAKIRELDPNRSPSPPPIYDSNGKRVNTREVRMRDALVKERADVIEQIMKLNPFFKPPADFVRPKPTRKLYIPYKEYPSYNFIGLIIGPR